jgi:hypothetical protein
MTFYIPPKRGENMPIEEKECFICWAMLFVVLMFTLGYAMYITMQATKTVKYDCRMATYPMAVDVPQEVIRKCRGLL